MLNQLCMRLMDNIELLHFFFVASEEQFLIFSILVSFLHKEGHVGQLARDALLHCMSLSKKNDSVGNYIAANSNFCTVLATGLSALYSSLPRHLPKSLTRDPTFHRITEQDISPMQELKEFLSSLMFCDAVVSIAHDKIRDHLLALVYMGFLVPVMGPALTQVIKIYNLLNFVISDFDPLSRVTIFKMIQSRNLQR